MKLVQLILLLLVLEISKTQCEQSLKVIGVLTIPNYRQESFMGLVDEIYYNYLRQGGLKVVAMPYWQPKSYLKRMLFNTNGLFLQGGVTTYFHYLLAKHPSYRLFNDRLHYLLNLATTINSLGDYYPVFGTCMGFHLLAMHFAQSNQILSKVEHKDSTSNLQSTPHFYSCPPFNHLSSSLKEFILNDLTSNYFNHQWAILASTFHNNSKLSSNFHVLAYAQFYHHSYPLHFVSAIKHKLFPFFGFQQHFEKSQFLQETNNHVPRGQRNFQLGFFMSNFIAQQLHKNKHQTQNIQQYNQYNLYYKQPQQMLKHYDPKAYTFYFNPFRSYI